jgi:hypothetical protein
MTYLFTLEEPFDLPHHLRGADFGRLVDEKYPIDGTPLAASRAPLRHHLLQTCSVSEYLSSYLDLRFGIALCRDG